MSLTTVGSLNYDVVTYVNTVPQAGETIMANTFETHIGGKGLNQTVAMAKLCKKFPVRIVGNVGDDSFGKEILESLKSMNVKTDYINILTDKPDVRTGVATILVENSGQNRIMVTPGANAFTTYTDSQLSKIFPSSDDKDYVVLQNEIPDPYSVVKFNHENRPKNQIIYNPSPFNACEVPNEIWRMIDVLIVNEIEGLQIVEKVLPQQLDQFKADIDSDFKQGYSSIAKVLYEEIISENGKGIVIITLGAMGCVFVGWETPLTFKPAISVDKIVDTTGAGDTFLGGVVSQLSEGANLTDAVMFATVASSLTIQKEGASGSIPHYDDVINEQNKIKESE